MACGIVCGIPVLSQPCGSMCVCVRAGAYVCNVTVALPAPSIPPPLQPARPSHAPPHVPIVQMGGGPSMVQQNGWGGVGLAGKWFPCPSHFVAAKGARLLAIPACGAQTAAVRRRAQPKWPRAALAEPHLAAGARRTAAVRRRVKQGRVPCAHSAGA